MAERRTDNDADSATGQVIDPDYEEGPDEASEAPSAEEIGAVDRDRTPVQEG